MEIDRPSLCERPARLGTALALAAVLGLSACATPGYGPAPAGSTYGSAHRCDECGVIQGIVVEQRQPDGSIGLGAVIGGVAGAAVGSQIGKGSGQTAATIAGAAGGAYAGHQIEQTQKARTAYRFTVRMNDGSFTTVTQDSNPGFRVGDRVRVVGGRVVPR